MRDNARDTRLVVRQPTEVLATKVCPQCGQVLFEDMDVCYGCLYDFSRKVDVGSLGLPVTLLEGKGQKGGSADGAGEGQQQALDTRDVSPSKEPEAMGAYALRVSSEDVELTIPLPSSGVMVGRLSTNDIVLRSRSVSRHHVLIVPCEREVRVIDQGATNPAVLDGVEVASSAVMMPGSTLDVCGVLFTLVREGGDVTDIS